jgi:hypothetical protein
MYIAGQTTPITNRRGHWRARAAQVKRERQLFYSHWILSGGPKPPNDLLRSPDTRILIRFTRIASRTLDTDNLPSAYKSWLDELCCRWKFSDGDSRLTLEYTQRKREPEDPQYATLIEMEVQHGR